MRWIVVSLLLVNALILGWRWFAPVTELDAVSSPKQAAAPVIELLPDGSVAPVPSSDGSPAGSPASDLPELTQGDSTQSDPNQTDSPQADPSRQDGLAASAATESGDPASALLPTTVTAAEPSTETSAASGVANPAPETAMSPASASSPTSTSAKCAWTDWVAAEPTPLLGSGHEVVREERREYELGRSYLVYISAKTSREQTLARLAEIKALGIEAAYLNKGPQAGGISLGLFSKSESMALRLRQLKEAGVADASGIERIRTEPQMRRLLRWSGEKTASFLENQSLVACDEIAPAAVEQ